MLPMKKEYKKKLIKDLRLAFEKNQLTKKNEKTIDYEQRNLDIYIKLGIMR